jgi:mannose/fructose/N-acetylgalactosamine-specific phosphotransferase system component IIC
MYLADITLGPADLLLIAVAGALVGVDSVTWMQAMISRPIVAGTIGGALVGGPAAGFLVGAFLELFSFRHPPYGAARYPDSAPASLVAGAGYAAAGGTGLGSLLLVIVAGWGIGWIGARSVQVLRSFNTFLARDPVFLARRPVRIEVRQRLGIVLDGLRAALLAVSFTVPVAILAVLGNRYTAEWGGSSVAAGLLVVALAGVVGAGSRTIGGGLRMWPLLLAGAAAGLLALAVL